MANALPLACVLKSNLLPFYMVQYPATRLLYTTQHVTAAMYNYKMHIYDGPGGSDYIDTLTIHFIATTLRSKKAQ